MQRVPCKVKVTPLCVTYFAHDLLRSYFHKPQKNEIYFLNEPMHDKTNNRTCAPREDSDQPGHPPSLIRVFAVRMKKGWVLSFP